LRLAFQATPDRVEAAMVSKPLTKLTDDTRAQVLEVLRSLDGETVWTDRDEVNRVLGKALGNAGVTVGMPVRKALLAALGERDDQAEICSDAKGRPETDPKLRDTENVPLDEDIDDYVAREIAPYVPDAWVDHGKTRIGYEIPFTRHFFEYVPPRPLEEIDADVKRLIGEIQQLFAELDS
jgi:type I restriction enzyme M protein